MRRPSPRGFTLVELLVVIAIVGLISAVALPVVLPALNERRVSESARLLQAVLAGTRDAAIRANAPRGIRLLPDPVFNPNAANALPGVLASNRFVAIEPAPDYAEGEVQLEVHSVTFNNLTAGGQITKSVLSIKEVTYVDTANTIYGNPTSWYWNIRQGDRIRFNDAGDYYTVVGPMVYGPPHLSSPSGTITNAERYINVGPPANTFPTTPQFLYVLNGEDDNGNGFIDEAFDGIDNDGDGIIDPSFNGLDDDGDGFIDNEYAAGEFEDEQYDSSQYTPFTVSVGQEPKIAYTIYRRPVVAAMARETTLPSGIVIDMTTWNAPSATPAPSKTNPSPTVFQPERSRLPIDPYTYYVDIMIAPNGQVSQGGAGASSGDYNGLAPSASQPFFHFWLTEREGVVSPLWGEVQINNNSKQSITVPMPNPNYASSTPQTYFLPMPKGTPNYASTPLTGERRLVTLFVKTGQIVTNSIESFNGNDTNAPFYDAQSGIKEQQ